MKRKRFTEAQIVERNGQRGDQLVENTVTLPETNTPEQQEIVEQFGATAHLTSRGRDGSASNGLGCGWAGRVAISDPGLLGDIFCSSPSNSLLLPCRLMVDPALAPLRNNRRRRD